MCDGAAQEARRASSLAQSGFLSSRAFGRVTRLLTRQQVKDSWGWRRWDPSSAWKPADGTERVGGEQGDGAEIVLERVRLRVWRSEHNWDEQ